MWSCRCPVTRILLAIGLLGTVFSEATAQRPSDAKLDANRTLSILVDGHPLTIQTTNRLAGAVHSIRWKGQEFIDSADHGRQLQSASSFDAMSDDPFWAERYNPTEAGSRRDGATDHSSSRLLGIDASYTELKTSTQMAFWLNPGENSQGRKALNNKALSEHILHKRVCLGAYQDPHVIQIDNTFQWPETESHRYAQFEVLTGYMPPAFSEFWRVELPSGELKPLDDGPGEQSDPVVLSTIDHQFAMGAFAVAKPDWIESKPGYGRFRFADEKVVKWNVVHRYRETPRLTKAQASFRVLVFIGSLEQVRKLIEQAARGQLKQTQTDAR